MRVAITPENNLSLFPVPASNVYFDAPVVTVATVNFFHASRPFSFISANAPTNAPAGW
jgi:hypothetical protein